MSKLFLAAGVLNQTPLDWNGNRDRIIHLIDEAQSKQINILCLPELCISGYGCEDQFLAQYTIEQAWKSLTLIAQKVQNTLVILGLPIRWEGKLYNVAACLYQQKIQALIPKQHLANDGVHYEARWFTPWPNQKLSTFTINDQNIPLGDYRIQLGNYCLGIEICQDAWEGAQRPAYSLAKRGVSLICNPTASHFSFGKSEIRKKLVLEGASIIQGAYLFANLLGNESGRIIFDGDAYLANENGILAESKRFSYRDSQLIFAGIDLKKVEPDGDDIIYIGSSSINNPSTFDSSNHFIENWEKGDSKKEEEFARSVALGLWDYMRKSYSNGWVISLSGGADSSAIASLCYLSIQMAFQELGLDQMKERLSFIPWMKQIESIEDLTHRLITTMYQGTQNSSSDTRDSAFNLANFIYSDHFEIEIDTLVEGYQHMIEKVIQRDLTWEKDDIALQNVQARVRSPSIWMLANIKNALLLATSNRSEASVGYATMDGDTSGSISPIAGIDKSFIRIWLKWLEEKGLNGSLRVTGLSSVNQLEPSAELRPLSSKQIDEEDLMPYPILNSIERMAFYDRLSPKECLQKIKLEYGHLFSDEKLLAFCQRYFRLWARNQWKRERYAPGFHVDDYSLDPKSWLRFPILSGGLEKDLF